MEKLLLKAQPRDVIGKQVKALRRQGRLPAVLYGRSLEPIPVSFDFREANRILPGITSSHLIVIDVNGEEHTALVREKQFHPVQGKLVHVDFMVVLMTERLRANVSIQVEGESPAVENLDGVMVTGLEEIDVECLPQYLPERIYVDISSLDEIGSAIYVRDLQLDANVRVLTDAGEMLVLITAPEVEEEPVEEGTIEPEVIEKGKKEEEEF